MKFFEDTFSFWFLILTYDFYHSHFIHFEHEDYQELLF